MVGMAWATMTAVFFETAGPAVLLSVLLGAIFSVIIGLGYAELCSALPYAGGEYVYANRALGRVFGFATGWFLLAAYGTMMPAEVIILSQIIKTLVPALPLVLIGIVVAILFGIINYLGIKISGWVQFVLAVLLFTGMAIFIVGGLGSVQAENLTPFMDKGFIGMLTLIPIMMLAFMGFDIVPQAAEEVNAPIKKVVFLIPLSIVFVAIFYLGVFLVSAGISPEVLLKSEHQAPIIDVAALYLGEEVSQIILLTGAIGLITTMNAFLVGASRLIFGMARGGALPNIFSYIHTKFKTPYVAIILLTILGITGAISQELYVVLQLSSAALMVVFIFICISVIALRKKEPELNREYKVPLFPILPIIGLVVSIGGLLVALTTIELPGLIVFFLWLIVGFIYYTFVLRKKEMPILDKNNKT